MKYILMFANDNLTKHNSQPTAGLHIASQSDLKAVFDQNTVILGTMFYMSRGDHQYVFW